MCARITGSISEKTALSKFGAVTLTQRHILRMKSPMKSTGMPGLVLALFAYGSIKSYKRTIWRIKMGKRTHYGVKIQGVSGCEIAYCKTRSDANRIRRVLRAYKNQGYFTSGETLSKLCDFSAQKKGAVTQKIIAEFIKNREK